MASSLPHRGLGAVREIYDRSKPDELRGLVNCSAIRSLEADPDMNALFRDSRGRGVITADGCAVEVYLKLSYGEELELLVGKTSSSGP